MKTSDIDLNIDFSSDNKNDLQRTEEWFLQRNGEITSTTCKSLMACDNSGGKLPWNEKIKVYSFSSGIVKLVYEKAMQQKSGRYIDSGKGSYAMQYGTAVEPLILKAAKKDKKIKKLLKKGYTIEEVGYKSFPNIPNAGASSDGIIRKPNGDIYAVIEMKACTAWGTHFERTFDSMKAGHIKFLLSCKCLDEGVDIPACESAILMANSTVEREFIQRRGRVLRPHPDKKTAIIFDLFVLPYKDAQNQVPLNEVEREIITSELNRIRFFAEDATNSEEIIKKLNIIDNIFNLRK